MDITFLTCFQSRLTVTIAQQIALEKSRIAWHVIGGSVEELTLAGQLTGNESILEVINTNYGGKYVVSILRALNQNKTGAYTSATLGAHELGGGNLQQTYVWMEKYDPCDPLSKLGFYAWRWHDREEWVDWYSPMTEPIPGWDALY